MLVTPSKILLKVDDIVLIIFTSANLKKAKRIVKMNNAIEVIKTKNFITSKDPDLLLKKL
jgi:rRNA processing protein Krr1/Pno1